MFDAWEIELHGHRVIYRIAGEGAPVVLIHGMVNSSRHWESVALHLADDYTVIAPDLLGHGDSAAVRGDYSLGAHAASIRDLLAAIGIDRATIVGHSLGGGVAMQCAIRHPDKVRKVVVISSTFRRDGMIKEAVELIPKLTADDFKGSPIEVEYKKLSPTPDDFPKFVKRMLATASKGHDLGADKLKATTAPMFFIFGDADGIRLEHVAEMFRLKGGEVHGDLRPRSASRLAILPNTTHVTLMQRMAVIVPMVNDFLDAKP